MPPITLHMVLARRLAENLGAEMLAEQAGPYVLGATAPDIRVLTRQDRRSTHFFDLGTMSHQDSVTAFLREHGELADAAKLNTETAAFVAGYISHLVFDEQYIEEVYRKHFARHADIGGAIRANVMDRLLQFDLDREFGNDDEVTRDLCAALSCTVENIEVGFIETETLERWRQVTYDVASRNMDWDRMRGMIANHLRRAGLEEGETMSSFLDALPELLEETIAHVTSSEIGAYLERSSEAATRAVARYLACG
ncbi:MAG: hypothetical protein Kow0010_12870 [Dehalococcoidia bacterium]